jgi:hypothetical protein
VDLSKPWQLRLPSREQLPKLFTVDVLLDEEMLNLVGPAAPLMHVLQNSAHVIQVGKVALE